MSDRSDIPVLTDLIEPGGEISISDLGLDDELRPRFDDLDDTEIEIPESEIGDLEEPTLILGAESDPLAANPDLERKIRRILDEHMELALQEIKLVLQRELSK